MVLAACAQLYAGLAASALAALDDYLTAAVSYIVASAAGLGVHPARGSTRTGSSAVAVGMALNGLIAVALPTFALVRRARAEDMPRSAVRPSGPPIPRPARRGGPQRRAAARAAGRLPRLAAVRRARGRRAT